MEITALVQPLSTSVTKLDIVKVVRNFAAWKRGETHVFMGAKCELIAYNIVVSCKAVEDPMLSHAEGCDYYVGRGV